MGAFLTMSAVTLLYVPIVAQLIVGLSCVTRTAKLGQVRSLLEGNESKSAKAVELAGRRATAPTSPAAANIRGGRFGEG